jgi:hypothetical protein
MPSKKRRLCRSETFLPARVVGLLGCAGCRQGRTAMDRVCWRLLAADRAGFDAPCAIA